MAALGGSGGAILVSCDGFGSRSAPLVMQLMTTEPTFGSICWGLLYKNEGENKWSKVWWSTKTLASAWEMFDRGELQPLLLASFDSAAKRATLNGFLMGFPPASGGPAPAPAAAAAAAAAAFSSPAASSSSSSSSSSAAAAYTVVPFEERLEWHRPLLLYGDLFLQAKASGRMGGLGNSQEEAEMLAYGNTLDAHHP